MSYNKYIGKYTFLTILKDLNIRVEIASWKKKENCNNLFQVSIVAANERYIKYSKSIKQRELNLRKYKNVD